MHLIVLNDGVVDDQPIGQLSAGNANSTPSVMNFLFLSISSSMADRIFGRRSSTLTATFSNPALARAF